MMVAKAVTTGHHCGSFQSVQKSQSPANNSLVISAAPATIKIAVIQNTASQVRSIKMYLAFSSSRSSRRCSLSAADTAAGVLAITLTSLLYPPTIGLDLNGLRGVPPPGVSQTRIGG